MNKTFLTVLLYSCIFTLTSCNNGEITRLNNKVDSLITANEALTKELEGYKYSPSKILEQVKEYYEKQNIEKLSERLALLHKYHPESKEYQVAKNFKIRLDDILKAQRKKEEAKRAKEEAERRAKMKPIERTMEKYGCSEEFARAINKGHVMMGMTKEMARAAWGRPRDINRSVGSYGVHEQWCYNGCYLYFEDGILTSWQN